MRIFVVIHDVRPIFRRTATVGDLAPGIFSAADSCFLGSFAYCCLASRGRHSKCQSRTRSWVLDWGWSAAAAYSTIGFWNLATGLRPKSMLRLLFLISHSSLEGFVHFFSTRPADRGVKAFPGVRQSLVIIAPIGYFGLFHQIGTAQIKQIGKNYYYDPPRDQMAENDLVIVPNIVLREEQIPELIHYVLWLAFQDLCYLLGMLF